MSDHNEERKRLAKMSFRIIHIGGGKTVLNEDIRFADPTVEAPRRQQKMLGVASTLAYYRRMPIEKLEAIRAAARVPYSPGKLLVLERDACRYVIKDDDYTMCGRKSSPGSSWCSHHRAICVTGFWRRTK